VCPGNQKFEHACFISYKHPPKNAPEEFFYQSYVRALKKGLEYYLATEFRTFLDEDADPGSFYPKNLSQTLCKSVCMLAVLTPDYQDSNWCRAEWEAMENFEAKRLGGRRGLIIPIVARGKVKDFENRFKRTAVDLVVALPAQLKNPKNAAKVQKLAGIIDNWVRQVHDPCEDCTTFEFNLGPEELTFPPSYNDPDPLAG